MRELTLNEVSFVSGGADSDCGGTVTVGTSGVKIQSTTSGVYNDIIAVYEGLIGSASYMIERVANSFK